MTEATSLSDSLRRGLTADEGFRIVTVVCTDALAEASARAGLHGIDAVARNVAIAERHENAALLSSLMLLRAEALDLTGRTSEARAVRLDSMGWARYGYGADWAVRAKMREVSSLNPLKRN